MKYGLLMRAGFWFGSTSWRDWPLLMSCLSLPISPVAAFIVEKSAQKKCLSDPVVVFPHVLITSASVLYPITMIIRFTTRWHGRI